MRKLITFIILCCPITALWAQHNFTTGRTTLINPTAGDRTLEIKKDNDDSFITFHDPEDSWYSMGLNRASGLFKLSNGGNLSGVQFTMNSAGNIGIGTIPYARLDVLGQTFTQAITDKVVAFRLKNAYDVPGRFYKNSAVDFLLSRWEAGGDHRPETQLDFRLSGNANGTYDNSIPNVDVLTLRSDGNVGIGTTSPQALLDIGGLINNEKLGAVFGRLSEGNTTGNGTFLGVKGYGTQFNDYDGKSFAIEHNFYGQTNSSINFFRGNGTTGGYIAFNTNQNNERLRITSGGNVGIGTNTPSEKLEVAGNARFVGNIYSKKVKVSTTAGSWPDYVFENDYQLTPLSQLEAFVKTNKHLPEVPSTKEVEANGQDLGDIQARLLKKVEELTLYLIEESKEKEQLKRENQELKALFLQLNKEIKQLKKEIK